MTKLVHVSLLATTALAVAAPVASADRYVAFSGSDSGSCQTEAAPCRTIQAAVTKAATGEAVRIAAGLYEESVMTGKRVHLIGHGSGTGAGATRILGQGGNPAIKHHGGGSIMNLHAMAGSNATGAAAIEVIGGETGVARAFKLGGVSAVGGRDTADEHGTPAVFAHQENGGALQLHVVDSDFTQHDDDATTAPVLDLQGAGAVDVRDTTITSDGTDAISATGATTLTLQTTRAAGGLRLYRGPQATVARSRFHALGDALAVSTTSEATKLVAADSVFISSGSGANRVAARVLTTGTGAVDADLVRSTIIARSPTVVAGVRANGAVDVDLRGTVVKAWDTDASATPVDMLADKATVRSTASAYGTRTATGGASIAPAAVTADPQFVNVAALDFRPGFTSPLLDGGPADEPGTTDLDGNPRAQDGDGNCSALSDIGAFERFALGSSSGCPTPPAPPAPAPSPAPPVASVLPSIRPVAPRTSGGPATPPRTAPTDRTMPRIGRTRAVGRKLTFALSEDARVQIAVDRRKPGGWTRAATSTAKHARGTRNVVLPKLAAGNYRIVLRATDAAGNRSNPRTLKISVR